jgi:hypothetical protein
MYYHLHLARVAFLVCFKTIGFEALLVRLSASREPNPKSSIWLPLPGALRLSDGLHEVTIAQNGFGGCRLWKGVESIRV